MAVRTFTPPTSLDASLTATDIHIPIGSLGGPLQSNMADTNNSSKLTEQTSKSLPHPAKDLQASNQQNHKLGITFASQDDLPKLPIPELESTCKKYLAALEPLQSYREHKETKAVIEEFLKHEGPELQDRLKKYATGKTNYIEQFCEHSNNRLCTKASH
jgi:carnitine O-acetyltransferase